MEKSMDMIHNIICNVFRLLPVLPRGVFERMPSHLFRKNIVYPYQLFKEFGMTSVYPIPSNFF